MMVDARVLDSNMKSSASLLSASESMVESVDELRSIRELDEEHFGAIDGRQKRKTTLNTSLIDNASLWGYAGDKELQVDMKVDMIIQDM